MWALAEARARLEGQSKTLEETMRGTEETAKSKAFDEFFLTQGSKSAITSKRLRS
jgi:hypothetical protein